MPPANAGLVTLFAGLIYFADVFWGHTGPVARRGVWIQLGVFVRRRGRDRLRRQPGERHGCGARGAGRRGAVRSSSRPMTSCAASARACSRSTPTAGCCTPTRRRKKILGFKAREWLGRSVMPEFARLAPRVLGGGDVDGAPRRAPHARRGDGAPSRTARSRSA